MERTLAVDKDHPRWRRRGKGYEPRAQNTGKWGLSLYSRLHCLYKGLKLRSISVCMCEFMKELMSASGCVDECLDVWVPDGTMGALLDA
jgi:hypothetical protein